MTTLGQHIRRNTRVVLLGWFVLQVAQFIRLPLFWTYIGPAGVALWLIGFRLMGYITIYSLGLDTAYIKYTAEYHARKEYGELSRLLSTGVYLSVLIGGVLVLVLYFASEELTLLLMKRDIPTERLADFRYVILVLAVTTWFRIVLCVYRAILTGIQRVDVVKWINIMSTPLELACMIAALQLGGGVRALITVHAAFAVGTPVVYAIYSIRLLPEVRLRLGDCHLDYVPRLFSLGGRMSLLGLVALIADSLDMLLVNKFYGLEFAGSYGTARQVSERAQGVVGQGLGPLVPASAHLHGLDSGRKIKQLYSATSSLTFILAAFIFAFTFVNADFILMVFMDRENFTPIALVFLIFMAISRIFHCLTGTGSTMLRGAGKPGLEIAYQFVIIAVFVVLFIIATDFGSVFDAGNIFAFTEPQAGTLVQTLQIFEALDDRYLFLLLSYPIALAAGSLFFLIVANRYFGIPAQTPFAVRTLVTCVVLIAIAIGLRLLWDSFAGMAFTLLPISWEFSRWPCLFATAVLGAAYVPIAGLAILVLPGLRRAEKRNVIRLLPGKNRRLLSLIG